ncbi:MAG: LLM class flavin-dependent oxidoreductase [Acidimicrobiales bacterium]
MPAPALSVLDLVPVRTDQTTSDALTASVSLARLADDLGYHRYWVAEHHNVPAVAATNPPVIIAMLAAATGRIRVGSGGVMLPNHAPLAVAEQFALLEAAHPGRIDLGIGRAPGTDGVTSWALRNGNTGDDAVARFPQYVDQVAAMMSPDGVGIDLGRQVHVLHATPKATSTAALWLLGSSDYSAQLAAERGLPYVFAHHFSGHGTAEALALYRQGYRPSEAYPEPRTFLTVNAVVAESEAEANRLVLPHLHSMLSLRSGGPFGPQLTVEEAEQTLGPDQRRAAAPVTESWIVGPPHDAAKQVVELAEQFGVDEVMVHPVAGATAGTPADGSPAREQTLQLLVDVLA